MGGVDGDWQAIARAEKLLDLRRDAEAEAAFRDVLVHDPESVIALLGLARALDQQGQHAQAEQVARRAVALAPEDAAGHHLLVDIHCQQGSAYLAVRAAERALALDPHSFLSHYQYGRALLLFPDRRAVAGRAAHHAVEIDPHNADGHALVGLCLTELGADREARAAYSRALAIDPHHVHAQNNLAALDLDSGKLGRAARLLRSAVAGDPQLALLHRNLDAVIWNLALRVVVLLIAGVQLMGTATTMGDLPWPVRALLGTGWLTLTLFYVVSVGRRLPRGLLGIDRMLRQPGLRHRTYLAGVAVLAGALGLLSFGPEPVVDGPARAVALAGIVGYPALIGAILAFVQGPASDEQ
jgi:Flp pilus assembly protein TadD